MLTFVTTDLAQRDDRPLRAPWTPLAPLAEDTWATIQRAALHANDRYLSEVVEAWAFCPFARAGREAGSSVREVHRIDQGDEVEGLLRRFADVAAREEHTVTQVLLPLAEALPDDFSAFCHALTAAGNARLPRPALACAPLHPGLSYEVANPYALVPLFRRAPDPTIQWVRLDGLEAIYEGCTSGTVCPTPEELEILLRDGVKPARKLYDRVVMTNAQMAKRLGIARIEGLLREISDEAHKSYALALLHDDENVA